MATRYRSRVLDPPRPVPGHRTLRPGKLCYSLCFPPAFATKEFAVLPASEEFAVPSRRTGWIQAFNPIPARDHGVCDGVREGDRADLA
jgi:hypothetical protein